MIERAQPASSQQPTLLQPALRAARCRRRALGSTGQARWRAGAGALRTRRQKQRPKSPAIAAPIVSIQIYRA
jgi:hypothetical protein